MNIIFMGSPEFAVPSLKALHENYNVIAVYSQPPRAQNRGLKLLDTPVASLAKEYNIPLFTPKTLKDENEQERLKSLNADLIVVAAYGLILPEPILKAAKFGAINVHASLLPSWRGAAPIHYAILNGDSYTGVTIMQMDVGLDTGDIIKTSKQVPITDNTKFADLYKELAEIGSKLIIDVVEELISKGNVKKEKQDNTKASYAPKISKDMYRINFSQTTSKVLRQINALSDHGAYLEINNENIKIFEATFVNLLSNLNDKAPGTILDESFSIKTLDGAIRPVVLQRPNKSKTLLKDFLNGFNLKHLLK